MKINILTIILCLVYFISCADKGFVNHYNNDCNDASLIFSDYNPIDNYINYYPEPIIAIDCEIAPFIEKFSNNFKYGNVFFIKGVILDFVQEYGCNIKIIKDFKGNFHKNITTFNIFGNANVTYGNLARGDYLQHNFERQDTLLMLLIPVIDLSDWGCEILFPEKVGDYVTLSFNYPVLKLSDCSVTCNNISLKENSEINNKRYVIRRQNRLVEKFNSGRTRKYECFEYLYAL